MWSVMMEIKIFTVCSHLGEDFGREVCELSLTPWTTSFSLLLSMSQPKENTLRPMPSSRLFPELNSENTLHLQVETSGLSFRWTGGGGATHRFLKVLYCGNGNAKNSQTG